MSKLMMTVALILVMAHAKASDQMPEAAPAVSAQASAPPVVEIAASAAEAVVSSAASAPMMPTLKAMGPDGKVIEVPADQVEQVHKAMAGAQRMVGAVRTVNAVQSVVQGITGLFRKATPGAVVTQRQMLDAASEAAAKREPLPQGSGLGSLLGLLSH